MTLPKFPDIPPRSAFKGTPDEWRLLQLHIKDYKWWAVREGLEKAMEDDAEKEREAAIEREQAKLREQAEREQQVAREIAERTEKERVRREVEEAAQRRDKSYDNN